MNEEHLNLNCIIDDADIETETGVVTPSHVLGYLMAELPQKEAREDIRKLKLKHMLEKNGI